MMGFEPQKFITPDGTAMVVITEDHYRLLLEAAEDADDLAAATSVLMDMRHPDQGLIPADVSRAVRAGSHPVTAWRKFQGMTQACLAEAANIPQSLISRIEAGKGYGRPETRRAIAKALSAPLWSLEQEEVTDVPALPD
jgi:DNA-binding XRE family transcriptional regulator